MNVIPLGWGVGRKDADDISKPLFTIQPDFPERFANGKTTLCFFSSNWFSECGHRLYISGLMHVEVVSSYICFFVAEINEST